jgi:peptide-methionine (R)-S-oxide reductase
MEVPGSSSVILAAAMFNRSFPRAVGRPAGKLHFSRPMHHIGGKKASLPMTKIEKPDTHWRETLSPEAYRVLREHGTERAGTSPLNHEKRKGVFNCAGCGKELFASGTKFESGTGWPSFYAPIAEDAVKTTEDRSWFMRRTEVHCADCGGHLGHVFPDGPEPTGLRYCMNGVALSFKPDGEA